MKSFTSFTRRQIFSVQHAVNNLNTRIDFFNVGNKTFPASYHARGAISTNTKALGPINQVFYKKLVNQIENIFTSCSGRKWLAKQEIPANMSI